MKEVPAIHYGSGEYILFHFPRRCASLFPPFRSATTDRLASCPRYDNNGTFTLTTTFGASASLTFNGTAVWIYGAKRDNHAPFNTTLDGKTYYDTGYSAKNLFQQVLFPGLELSNAILHNVSIVDSVTNAEDPYLDIDSVCLGLVLCAMGLMCSPS